MLARNAKKEDIGALDLLLKHNAFGDVRLDRDVIVVTGKPTAGALVWRPCALVHELECPEQFGLPTANALVNYAVGQASGRTAVIRDALFLVAAENAAMLRHAQRLGATEYPGKVFILDIG